MFKNITLVIDWGRKMIRKKIWFLIVGIWVVCVGCTANHTYENTSYADKCKANISIDLEKIADGYRDIYEKAIQEGTLQSLALKKEIIQYFGSEGYAAVDDTHQFDMIHYEQVEAFCHKAQNHQQENIMIFSVVSDGGFVCYDMQTNQGKIDVMIASVQWQEHQPQITYFEEFQADEWKYTEDGYFFIEKYRPPGYDGVPGQIGFRVEPLDQKCRELNQKYVMPIGYVYNNMLITDWSEEDYSNLDFYDLYDLMYRLQYGSDVPRESCYGGTEYEIPKKQFEEVFHTYFDIDDSVIEENAVYHADTQTYRYRSRGVYDLEFSDPPYPEVVAYEVQEDGTIKLIIRAVWIKNTSDCAISSELVIRPLQHGEVQYVSHHVLHTQDECKPSWYTPRLSDAAWEQQYQTK